MPNDRNRNDRRDQIDPRYFDLMDAIGLGREPTHVAPVIRHDGEGIQLPADLPLPAAVQILQRKMREEEETVNLHAPVNATPYDGAHALYQAMVEMFGVAVQNADFFGNRHNIQVVVDAKGTTVSVPWGEFQVPGIEGTIESGHTMEGERVIFQISASIKGKYREAFNELVERTKLIIATASIYRGKALDIAFTDHRGRINELPTIKFVNVAQARRPIFSQKLDGQFEHDVLAYVKYPDAVKRLRGSLKRGVLLAGPYGTGKTLTAAYIAKLANERGFTFIYCKPADVPAAIEFARLYEPAVIFAEDLETIAVADRTEAVNLLLNKMDGVDSKGSDIICVFTTNHLDKVNEAMLRPGRVDVIVMVTPPDAEAALRIAREYAQGKLADEDFTEAANMLAGMIPAVIAEAVARAQIRAIARTNGESSVITNADLIDAAESVQAERNAFARPEEKDDDMERFGNALGHGMGAQIAPVLAKFGSNHHGPDSQLTEE